MYPSPRAVPYTKTSVFLKYPANSSSHQIPMWAMPHPWPGLRKCSLSMLSNIKQCCVIHSPLTNKLHYIKEVDARDNRKCLQVIKNIKLFLWEESLLKIRPIRRKGCQLHLTENVSQNTNRRVHSLFL